MDEELNLESDLDALSSSAEETPRDLTTEEYLLGSESAALRQMREFEQAMQGEDPFGAVARESRRMGEKLHTSGQVGLSDTASEAFNRIAGRLTTPSMAQPSRVSLPGERESGFINRPGLDEYNRFLAQPGSARMMSFQFQQMDMARVVLTRQESTEVVTQRLRFLNPDVRTEEDRTTASILAPNELLIRADQDRVHGINHPYAFHMKLGATRAQDDSGLAYITTQNITGPLSRNTTLETMMMFKMHSQEDLLGAGADESAMRQEKALGQEIRQFVDEVVDRSKQWKAMTQMRGAFGALAPETQSARRSLYINEEIAPLFERALTQAKDQNDNVIMSMGEIGILTSPGTAEGAGETADRLRKVVYEMLESGNMTLVADERRIWSVLDAERERTKLQEKSQKGKLSPEEQKRLADLNKGAADPRFLKALDSGSVRTGLFGYHHDKSFAVYGKNGELKALEMGSANLTGMSLVPIAETTKEEKSRVLDSLGFAKEEIAAVEGMSKTQIQMELAAGSPSSERRELLQALLTPNSSESVIFLANEEYSGTGADGRPARSFRDLLEKTNRRGEIDSHFNMMAGRTKHGTQIFGGHGAEERISSQAIEKFLSPLRDRLESLSGQTSGLVMVSGRYQIVDGKMKMTGVSVQIDTNTGAPPTRIDLTTTNQGEVVLMGQDRLISGSVLINKNKTALNVNLGGETIVLAPGAAVEMNAVDTAVAAVAAIGRRVLIEETQELPTRWFASLSQGERTQAMDQLVAGALYTAGAIDVFEPSAMENTGGSQLEKLLKSVHSLAPQEQARLLARARNILTAGLMQEGTVLTTGPKGKMGTRAEFLENTFSLLTQQNVTIAGDFSADNLTPALRNLQIGLMEGARSGVTTDLIAWMYKQSNAGKDRARLNSVFSDRAAVKSITDAFLPINQMGYSGMQAKYRRPVMEVAKPLGRAVNAQGHLKEAGFMEPGRFGAATNLGDTYIRLMGSGAKADSNNMPLTGSYRFVKAHDPQMTVGAGAVFSKKLFRSVEGLASLTKKELESQMQSYGLTWEKLQSKEKEEQNERWRESIGEGSIIWTGYSALRPEQLPQRLKNLLGTRPVKDISQEAGEYIRSLGTQGDLRKRNIEDLLSGRIMPTLPQEQYEVVKEEIERRKASGESATEIQENVARDFRRAGAHQDSTLQGVIGGEKARRVAYSVGSSFLGDFNYGNVAYQQEQGVYSPMSVRFSAGRVINTTQTVEQIAEAFSADTFLVPKPVKVGETDYESGIYQLHRGEDGSRAPVRVGSYDSEGRIKVSTQFREFNNLRVLEGLTIKSPAFTHRHQQDSITFIPGGSVKAYKQNSRFKVEVDSFTRLMPDSTARPGFGSGKGPLALIEEDFFTNISSFVGKRFESFDPQMYGVFSPGTVKGYRMHTGAEIFASPEQRARAQAQFSTREGLMDAAAALALPFAGGEVETQQAIAARLEQKAAAGEEGAAQMREMALSLRRAVGPEEISTLSGVRAKEAVLAMPGLITLGGQLQGEDIDGLFLQYKETLRKAMSGDNEALETLGRGLAEIQRIGLESATDFGDGRMVASQGDLRVYSAIGMYEMLHVGESMLGGGFAPKQQNIGRDFGDVDRFQADVDHRQVVKQIAAVAGIDLESLNEENMEQTLAFTRSRIDTMFFVEGLIENLPSSALVTMGGQTEVDVEFQNVLSMRGIGIASLYRPWDGDSRKHSQHSESQKVFALLSSLSMTGRLDLATALNPDVHQVLPLFTDNEDARLLMDNMIQAREGAMAWLPGITDHLLQESANASTQALVVLSGGEEHAQRAQETWQQAQETFALLQHAAVFDDPDKETLLRAALASSVDGSGLALWRENIEGVDRLLDESVSRQLNIVGDDGKVLSRRETFAIGMQSAWSAFSQEEKGMTFRDYLRQLQTEEGRSAMMRVGAMLPMDEEQYTINVQRAQDMGRLLETKPVLDQALFNRYGNLRPLYEMDENLGKVSRAVNLGSRGDALNFATQAINAASAKSQTLAEESQKTLGKIFLTGMEGMSRTNGLLSDVAEQNFELIVPKLQYQHVEVEGVSQIRMSVSEDQSSLTRGVVLGARAMRQLSLTYTGGQEHAALTHQIELISKLSRLQDSNLLERVAQLSNMPEESRYLNISPEEMNLLQEVQELAAQSQNDVMELLSTKVMNRVTGNGIPTSGVTGFPVSDVNLNPDEVAIGSAFDPRGLTKKERNTMLRFLNSEMPEAAEAELRKMLAGMETSSQKQMEGNKDFSDLERRLQQQARLLEEPDTLYSRRQAAELEMSLSMLSYLNKQDEAGSTMAGRLGMQTIPAMNKSVEELRLAAGRAGYKEQGMAEWIALQKDKFAAADPEMQERILQQTRQRFGDYEVDHFGGASHDLDDLSFNEMNERAFKLITPKEKKDAFEENYKRLEKEREKVREDEVKRLTKIVRTESASADYADKQEEAKKALARIQRQSQPRRPTAEGKKVPGGLTQGTLEKAIPEEQRRWMESVKERLFSKTAAPEGEGRASADLQRFYRGGIPLGMAAAYDSVYDTLSMEELAKRSPEGKIRLSRERSSSSMVLPAAGRWFMGGGDTDGDAGQVLSSSLGRIASEYRETFADLLEGVQKGTLPEGEIEQRVKHLARIRGDFEAERDLLGQIREGRGGPQLDFWNALKEHQKQGSDVSPAAVEALLPQITESDEDKRLLMREYEMEVMRQEIRSGRGTPIDLDIATRAAEERTKYGDIRSFVQSWTGTDQGVAALWNPAEAARRSNIARAPLGHLDGTEDQTLAGLAEAAEARKLFEAVSRDEEARAAWSDDRPDFVQRAAALVGMSEERAGELASLVSNYTGQNFADVQRKDLSSLLGSGLIEDASAIRSVRGMTVGEVQKMFTKGVGSFYSESQMDGIFGAIGTAGGKLLGPIYNVITPMTMDVVGELAYSRALEMKDFRDLLGAKAQTLLQEGRITPEQAALMQQRLSDPAGMIASSEAKYKTAMEFSASIQQMMRDAIKAKKGTDLGAAVLAPFALDDDGQQMTLAQHLEAAEDEKGRSRVLEAFVSRNIGADLGSEHGNMTGIGALTSLYRYTTATDAELPELAQEIGNRLRKENFSVSEMKSSISSSLVETLVDYRMSGQSDIDFAADAKAARYLYSGQSEDDFERARLANPRLTETQFMQRGDIIAQGLSDRDTMAAIQRLDVIDSGIISEEQVERLRETAQMRRGLKENPSQEMNRIATASEFVQTSAGNVLLSLMQRKDQMNPNAVLGGALAAASGAMSYAHDSEGGGLLAALTDAVARNQESLGLPDGSGFFGGLLGIPNFGNTPEEKQLMGAVLSDKTVLAELSDLTKGFAAMHGIADDMSHLRVELLSEGIDAQKKRRIEEDLRRLAFVQQEASGASSAAQLQSILRQAGVTPQEIQVQQERRAQADAVAADVARLTRGENLDDLVSRRRHAVGTGLEMFLGPVLVGLAAGESGFDERALMLAIDVAQSAAMTPSFEDVTHRNLVAQLRSRGREDLAPAWMLNDKNNPQRIQEHMRRGRIRASLANAETPIHGLFQSFLQESLMTTAGYVGQQAVSGLVNAIESRNPDSVFASGAAKAILETASTLAVLSTSRAFAAQVSEAAVRPPDFVERMLRDFAEQIWQTVEQVQLLLNSPAEAYDDDTGHRIDMEVEAFPGLIAEGLETGLIVLDNENEVESEGDPYLEGALETVQSQQRNTSEAIGNPYREATAAPEGSGPLQAGT